MSTMIDAAAKTVSESTQPLRAALDEKIQDVRRAVVARRQAIEDRAAEVRTQVGRHPLMSLGVAVGVGALVGGLIGYTVGRRGSRPL